MPMDSDLLQSEIEAILTQHFSVYHEHSRMTILTNAIARAVVTHIQQNARTIVTRGSSRGSYEIK